MNKLPLLRLLLTLAFLAVLPATRVAAAKPSLEVAEAKFAELGDNTYSCTREANSTFYRKVDQLTEQAKDDAARFCAGKGKQLKIVAVDVKKPLMGTGFCSATVQFKALDAGDPELTTDEYIPASGRKGRGAPRVSVAPSATGVLYNDLLKLDDLRKKGILTEEEFQAEKQKVLSRSK